MKDIRKFEEVVIIALLIAATTFLGFTGKIDAENILFTLCGGLLGLAAPIGVSGKDE